MDALGLAVRVAVSLACVLALLWLFSRGMLRGTGGRAVSTARVRVLSRLPLGRNSSVAVVRVGERALVLGVADGRVQLLSEVGLEDVVDPADAAEVREELDVASASVPEQRVHRKGPLAGSALSPATWNAAIEVLRDRTIRR